MDQKRTQRIVGIVIVIALVIILFPLLFSKTETTTDVATVKAPPFPDQENTTDIAVQASNDASSTAQPLVDVPSSEKILTEKTADAEIVTKNAPPLMPAVNASPNESIKPVDSTEVSTTKLTEPVVAIENTSKPQTSVVKKVSPTIKSVSAKSKPNHANPKEIAKLNTVAWVVQMGSFRDKTNAHRMTDLLRKAGYKAFTHEVTAKRGIQTRVYVGPEYKQIAALKLSSQIEHDLNMHGIIVTYNPLSL